MAGIYIHIPFCRKACHYCNFHFSTNLNTIDDMVDAICQEIQKRAEFLKNSKVETVYFGGGTPSLLNRNHFDKIFSGLENHFDLLPDLECTIEVNPEDINSEALKVWKDMGANRLSIGVQSFFDDDLKYMNRAHDAASARLGIELSKEMGFDNISMDLIFGAHTTSDEMWIKNVQSFLDYDLQHLSAYGLTIEENTALAHFIHAGKLPEPDEGRSVRQFEHCMSKLEGKGFVHYEISNYGKPGYFSLHNTNYWKGVPYLGIGPAAHSFDGSERFWNASNNQKYIKNISGGKIEMHSEKLSQRDRFNESMLTGLRYYKGIKLIDIEKTYPNFINIVNEQMDHHIELGNVKKSEGRISLTTSGKLISDHVIADFFCA